MRIGLLTTGFPRFAGDVAGSFVLGFARALSEQGHRVEVLAPEPPERLEKPSMDANVELTWVPYLRPRALERTFYGAGVLDNLRLDPRAFLGLGPFSLSLLAHASARVSGWDALVSHWALPCALAAALVRGARPHLSVLHSADVSLLERLPGRALLARRLVRGASAMVFSSRELRRRFSALLDPLERAEQGARMHVCAMGIDEGAAPTPGGARRALRARLGLERFTVLSLGRLVPIKGLEHAIDAVAGLADIELVIAGEGPMREALAQRARSRGAQVRFVGRVVGAEKEAWLSAADAFVLPSVPLASGRTEGMPTSVLEAMQAGLPVIATQSGGLPDVVEHGVNGFLVSPGSSAEIRDAVSRLQRDRSERRRLAARARDTARAYEWNNLGPHFSGLITGEGAR